MCLFQVILHFTFVGVAATYTVNVLCITIYRRPDKLRVIWLRSHRRVQSSEVSPILSVYHIVTYSDLNRLSL